MISPPSHPRIRARRARLSFDSSPTRNHQDAAKTQQPNKTTMDWAFDGRGRHLGPLKTAESIVSDIVTSPTSTIPGSPASSDGDRRFSLHSLKSRARRSISGRESVMPGSGPRSQSLHARKLSKSRNQSTSSIALTHRGSGFSDDSGHF